MFVFLKAFKILLVPMAKIFVNQGSINYALLQSWIGEHGESLENVDKHGKDGKHQPDELQGEQVQLCLMISL